MSTPSNTTVAILAGGLGTRLRSVVMDRPKVLADVGGQPFLIRWLDVLAAAGFGKVVLCTGYRAEQVRECLGENYGRLRLVYSVELSPYGTGGALLHALPQLQSDLLLVLNGDSFCELNFSAFFSAHTQHQPAATLVLTQVEDCRRFGRVQLAASGLVERFEEKAQTEGPGLINAGVYLITRHLLVSETRPLPLSLEHDQLPVWVRQGIRGFVAAGPFIDIGTPESYQAAQSFFGQPLSLSLTEAFDPTSVGRELATISPKSRGAPQTELVDQEVR